MCWFPPIVTDHSGAHVSNLTQADFTILENGQQQKIAFFHHIRANTTPGEVATSQHPSEFTNRVQPISVIVPQFLGVFDLQKQLDHGTTSNARDELMKFLSESPALGEPVCLLAFDAEGVKLSSRFHHAIRPSWPARFKARKNQPSPKDSTTTNLLDKFSETYQGWNTPLSHT